MITSLYKNMLGGVIKKQKSVPAMFLDMGIDIIIRTLIFMYCYNILLIKFTIT